MARNRFNEYCVIGLGRFGSSLAKELTRRGASVLGVDRSPDLVQKYAEEIHQTAVLDSTDEDALSAIDVRSFPTVIVAIGNNFEANLITTAILKQWNVPNIICKAQTKRQRDILLRIGANKVVLPEYEQGQYLAMELMHPGVIDQFDLGPGYCVSELKVPEEFHGRKVSEIGLRGKFGVTLLVIKHGDKLNVIPPPDHVFDKSDVMVVVGSKENCDRLSMLA